MSKDTYELLALIGRYWFAALALLIVLRGWRACVQDNRTAKILRDWAGGAGCVGELVLTDDGTKRKRKKPVKWQVPAEAVLGSGGAADIRLRGRDIKKRHIFMTHRPGEMVLHAVNGAPFEARSLKDGTQVLRDGDTLSVGGMKLMMVFFDAEDAAREAPARPRKKPAQVLPEDASDDEFEDVWE
ncbi:MAG: hypothetical protein J5998_04880 [Clostridia bacterium]|nr:hypothetical protein [Clostridia bacterium]